MSYHAELNAIAQLYLAAHPGKSLAVGEQDRTGNLTPNGARMLHYSLCQHSGLTPEQAVDDWNRRSPEDPWKIETLPA